MQTTEQVGVCMYSYESLFSFLVFLFKRFNISLCVVVSDVIAARFPGFRRTIVFFINVITISEME